MSPTPFAAPTPMSMAARDSVPQFLFTADSGSAAVIADRIMGDGSLVSVPGSPFPVTEPPRKVAALGASLLVAGTKTLTAYTVDKNSGAIQPMDSLPLDVPFDMVVDASTSVLYAATRGQIFAYRLTGGTFQPVSSSANPISPAAFARAANTPALDATGHFAYFVNTGASEIAAFHFDAGKLTPLSPPSYPAGTRPLSVAVVVP